MKAIIVFYDSLNKYYLPPYGNTEVIAPNFTRLAQKAITFDNSYVGSMPCIPARRELHTGRYNLFHREWGPLEPFDDSLPEILKKNGVYTHLVSDHLHYWEDGGANYHTRYSSWEIIRGQEGDHWKGEVADPTIPPVVSVPEKMQGSGTSGLWRYDWVNRQYIRQHRDFPQHKVFDLGCEFIEKNHAQDQWLLQIETFDPHEPFYAPQEFLDLYPESYQGKHFDWPRGQAHQQPDEIDHVRHEYKALVSMCDYHLGRVLDLMDQHDLWKDTLLIVGTDHGFLLGEHAWWGKNKMPYFNEIANTPLFIYDPRLGIQNERRQSLVQLIDWNPTLYEFFNVKTPDTVLGKSMTSVLKDDQPIRSTATYGAFSAHVNITDGHYTYMRAPLPHLKNEIYNYTLVPHHMNARFSAKELQNAELVKGFSFTKGAPLLKIKSKDLYDVAHYGTLLFDLESDPQQNTPIANTSVETQLTSALVSTMREHEAPEELYVRLGLTDEQKG